MLSLLFSPIDSARLGAGSVRSGMRRSREMIPASTAASVAGAGSVMAAFEREKRGKKERRKENEGKGKKVIEERGKKKDTKKKITNGSSKALSLSL